MGINLGWKKDSTPSKDNVGHNVDDPAPAKATRVLVLEGVRAETLLLKVLLNAVLDVAPAP